MTGLETRRLLPGAVYQHDREYEEHEHATHVHEQLDHAEERRAPVHEETCDGEQECRKSDDHARDIAGEHGDQTAGDCDPGEDGEDDGIERHRPSSA